MAVRGECGPIRLRSENLRIGSAPANRLPLTNVGGPCHKVGRSDNHLVAEAFQASFGGTIESRKNLRPAGVERSSYKGFSSWRDSAGAGSQGLKAGHGNDRLVVD